MQVLVILDSNHERSFVRRELEAYAPLVTVGSYVVVEDTKMDRMMGADDGRGRADASQSEWHGPASAVADFLASHSHFELDRRPEALWYTQHPRGFLRRRQ